MKRGQADLKKHLCSWMIFEVLTFFDTANHIVVFGGITIKVIVIAAVIKGIELLRLVIAQAMCFEHRSFNFEYTMEGYCLILYGSYSWVKVTVEHKAIPEDLSRGRPNRFENDTSADREFLG